MRKTALVKLLTAAAAAAATVVAGPAFADPTPNPPATGTIVGVGSDTTQALFNKLSTDYTGTPKLASFDATGSATIVPKAGITAINRPNGSGAGVATLEATNSTQVDFARSSSALTPATPANDWFIPFAKDAVTWAAEGAGSHAPANLTKADLTGIYSCTIQQWSQITDIPGYVGPNATIQAFLPQSGSGTRSFFLGSIGVTTPGGCVNSTVEENEGTNVLLHTADAIVPYSVAHFLGQTVGGHASGNDAPGPLTLHQANGIAPISTTVPNTINTTFASSIFGRNVWDVVRGTDWNAGDAHAAALKAIFSTSGFVCKDATAKADIASFGFLPLATCGIPQHN